MPHRIARAAALLLLLPACSSVDVPTAPTAAASHIGRSAVSSIAISPSETHLELGETRQLRATVLDHDGRPLNLPVTWSSSDPRVAMVGTTGLVTALSLGVARINVAAQGFVAVGWLTTYPVSRIAWESESGVSVMNGFGNNQVLLIPGGRHPDWSPDGTRIAFYHSGVVGVANADGSGTAMLLPGNRPRWSPAGTAIALFREDLGPNEIWITSPAGGGQSLVTTEAWGDISWSPDGARLAFLRLTDPSGSDIIAVNVDGTGPANLSGAGESDDDFPRWSPDGSKIAFHRDGHVFVMNPDGSGKTNLTAGHGGAQPVWSPDGGRIGFQFGNDLYVMNADGSGKTPLTSTPAILEDRMSWSPDGGRIVFRLMAPVPGQPTELPNGDIAVLSVGTGQVWNLTNSPTYHDDDPVWRPGF